MRSADSRIIEAIIGALLAAAVLLAAFAVIAQEPASTDRPIVELADWADPPAAQAMPSERAGALSGNRGGDPRSRQLARARAPSVMTEQAPALSAAVPAAAKAASSGDGGGGAGGWRRRAR
jgi:hypothetical protein